MEKRLHIHVTGYGVTQADMDVIRVWLSMPKLVYDKEKTISFRSKFIHLDGTVEEGMEKEADRFRELLTLLKLHHTTKIVQR